MTDTEKQEIIDAVIPDVISQLLSDGRDITGLNSVESLEGISTFPAVLTTTTDGVTTKAIVSVPISLLTQAVQDVIDDAVDATTDAQSAAAGWAAAAHKTKGDITIINGNITNLQDADKSLSSLTAYAECSTAANVSSKAVTVPFFSLPTNGGCLHVKMENANTAVSGVTLNINATGAKDLLYNGSAVSATNTWEDNEILEIYYDGTNYQATNAQGGGGSADKISFNNSTNGFIANNVQRAIEEVASSLEEIDKDYSFTEDDDSIEIEDEQGNKVVEITPDCVDAKNLKSNGKNVVTEDELDLLATKEEVEGKQDEIEGIEQTKEAIQTPTIEFRDDEDNYVGEVSPQAIAAKKFLIKQNPNDEGVDIASIVGGVSIAKRLGLSDIIHVIGYGQSLMAGSSSGTPVTTTQNRSNLFRFEGGVRPYDVFDLDTNKRVAIKRQNGVNPSYLEMSDNKDNCLEQSDITKINTSVGSLIPLTEQRINYVKNQDNTYSPTNSGGTFDARHADGETPLSGFCEGFLSNLEKTYGNNFGFDMLATCCAYGSADFPSLLPFDREGRTHNPSISDGSNMNYFEVLLMSVKGAKAIADIQNKSYSVDVVVYMESATQTPNISGVTVTNAMRAYRIAQLFTLINQRVKAITKQSNDILFLCDQGKTYDTQREALRILAVDKEISLTQAEKSALDTLNNCYIEPYDMSKIYLVTSANNYPIRKGYDPNDTGGDRIHHPSQVQKQKGATIGNAYADILTGKGFSPLSPIGIQMIGNDIYIKYHVPVSPIVIDTDAINGYQNHPTYMNGYGKYGFGISNGADNPVYYDIIDTVEVVESDTIKISCSDSLNGKTLEYCYHSMANNADGATGPTNSEFGNIRDSQGDVKKITISNTDYPLHNWCIGFSKQL